MKAKQLAQVIRKIVREEVQKEVRNVLSEQKKTDKSNGKMSLNEALNQTMQEDYPTMKTFNASDARAGFAQMQNGFDQTPVAFEGHGGRVVQAEKVDQSVSKALTRDYSELVKRFKK